MMFWKRLSWVLMITVPLGALLGVAASKWAGHPAQLRAAQPPRKPGLQTRKLSPVDIARRKQGKVPFNAAMTGQSGVGFAKLSVNAIGHKVSVDAGVQIWDVTGARRYVWLLRVYPDGVEKTPGTLLQEHHYLDQVFTPPVDETVSPTFHESLELPTGSYRVEVIVYSVPPDFRLDQIPRGQDLKMLATSHLLNFKKIRVTD
jgi:hypothetical protein